MSDFFRKVVNPDRLRSVYFAFFIAIFCLSCRSTEHVLLLEGDERSYRVFLPKGYDPESAGEYPVVLNFHGLLSTENQQEIFSGMNSVADTAGFIVVYPRGEMRTWNTGLLRSPYKEREDVNFISALLDSVIQNYSVDTSRIYAAGMSMGGFFSYRLACDMGNRFAAIASVTGLVSDSTAANCTIDNPIPVLHIHGTWDPIVNYSGLPHTLNVEETIDFWAEKNRCAEKPDTLELRNDFMLDYSSVKLIRYQDCQDNAQVWFYKVKRGGHSWPGGKLPTVFLGLTNKDISASAEIWSFFRNFKK